MAFKPSYNIMDRDTHNALVNAFKTGGIAYTDDDGTVHKIADDYINGGGGGSSSGGTMKATIDMTVDAGTGETSFGTCSKTGTELAEAITSGELPYLIISIYIASTLTANMISYPASFQPYGGDDEYITSFTIKDMSSGTEMVLMVYPDGNAAISQ